MAFFKFRSHGAQGDEQSAGPAETIDGMRRRARHRLIGAALLVLVGVVGFPLLFDTQPRPIAVDIPIDIPDKAKLKPLAIAKGEAKGEATAEAVVKLEKPASTVEPVVAEAKVTKEAKVTTESSLDAREEVVAPRPPPAPKVDKPAPAKPEVKPEPKPEPKPVHKADEDGAKAKALLEGKSSADAGGDRFIVQVGAFADTGKARDARQKLEHAGLKTYTQVVETKDGPRTRVRVGPFANKTEADKAASKIKALDLSASILAL
jgi:DedD protein